jgi:hypothetical protein
MVFLYPKLVALAHALDMALSPPIPFSVDLDLSVVPDSETPWDTRVLFGFGSPI